MDFNLFCVRHSVCPHIWASVTISVPSQHTVHLKMLHVESHLSCVFCYFFSLNVFYGQAFINLFYSSSPLFQFPGKKPLVGRNVRAISVSVPFFPCVNALPSKSTASLCIYCVRRWVLSFFPLFMDEICPLFLSAESDMVMDCWCARSERLNERTRWERENLNASVRCRKATCWLWEEPVWASVNEGSECFFL